MIIWVYGTSQHITWVFLPSSSADLAVGLSNRWFFKPGLKTFNSPFHLTQRRSLTFNNIMNGYLQHDWWVWVPYIVTTGVGLFGFLWEKIMDIGRFSRGSNRTCMYVSLVSCQSMKSTVVQVVSLPLPLSLPSHSSRSHSHFSHLYSHTCTHISTSPHTTMFSPPNE